MRALRTAEPTAPEPCRRTALAAWTLRALSDLPSRARRSVAAGDWTARAVLAAPPRPKRRPAAEGA